LSRFSSRVGGGVPELSSTLEGVMLVVVAFGAVVEAMMRLLNGAACKDPVDAQGVFSATRQMFECIWVTGILCTIQAK
jgi:divalent metal cation (Fe/Co/Zn/Cd) transporter